MNKTIEPLSTGSERPAARPLLAKREIAALKARAQHLNPVLKLGKLGFTEAFLVSLRKSLQDHELIKVKLVDFKEERHEMAEKLATDSGSHLVAVIGHVVILYLPRPTASTTAG